MKGKKARWLILSVAVLFIVMLVFAAVGGASTLHNSLEWGGQGSDSLKCGKLGESPERTEDGWIHWIVTQGSGITKAELVLGGSGSGTYLPTKDGPVVEFFTPYFHLIEGEFTYDEDDKPIIHPDDLILTATLYYEGTLGHNPQFNISDYCPGTTESLAVTKTAVTSYTRTHNWDIDKAVGTEKEAMVNGTSKIWLYVDGSGDEKATWTVDVTYEGYEDSDFNVSGEITIENTGQLDAVITEVVDELAGATVSITWPEETSFPYTLEVGQTLTGNYSEDVDSKIEGFNEVTVTTERAEYSADAEIIWGDPNTEINETVNIKDISELFDEVDLGTVTAPDDAQFTYDKDFAWADYGADKCGSFTYDNTATIVETEQSADATLKVNVQCFIYETAYAKGDYAVCFIPTFRNWGWTNPIEPGTYEMDLWAGAGQCDTSKGTLVGSVTVVYGENGYVTVTYNVDPPYSLEEYHVYAGTTMFPQQQRGRRTVDTVAPGQYYIEDDLSGEIYVIAHAVVGMPDPDFGP